MRAIAEPADSSGPPEAGIPSTSKIVLGMMHAKGLLTLRGPPASCNFEFASLLTETALLGVISQRTGKILVWDAQNMSFSNDADANQYLNPPYRSGWSL